MLESGGGHGVVRATKFVCAMHKNNTRVTKAARIIKCVYLRRSTAAHRIVEGLDEVLQPLDARRVLGAGRLEVLRARRGKSKGTYNNFEVACITWRTSVLLLLL